MIYKILFAVTILAEFYTVPTFLKYYWPKKCKQSLIFKMISATLFVLCGVFAMKMANNVSSYAYLMIIGFVFGWFGDLLLHSLKDKMVHFALGVVSFLVGHIFFTAAFHHAIKTLNPEASLFAWYELVAIAVLLVAVVIFGICKKYYQKKGPLVFVLLFYGLFLVAMFVKAMTYCATEWLDGMSDYMYPAILTAGLGAFFFLLSDGSLGIILMGDETKRGMRIFNIVTYFIAQILLAASILFIRSQIIV